MPSNGAAMRRVFEIGVYVLVADILVQLFLAGLGIFGSASLLDWHTTYNALVVFVLSIALVVVGRLGRYDRLTVGLPGIIVGMVILQSLLLFPYHLGAPLVVRAISALHVVNGVAIFWVALHLMDRARHRREVAPARA
jgi:hypothetical membrane protein